VLELLAFLPLLFGMATELRGSGSKTCPDCDVFDQGQWRTGVCDECKRLEAGTWCNNCQGTGSPICCRCEGTGCDPHGASLSMKVDLNPDVFLRLTGSSLRTLSPGQTAKHKRTLEEGGQTDPAWLLLVRYDDGSIGVEQHDGRHRSRAATLAGSPNISVVLEGPTDLIRDLQSGKATHVWSQPYDDQEIEDEGYLPQSLIQLRPRD
jgi:hypothetical protein